MAHSFQNTPQFHCALDERQMGMASDLLCFGFNFVFLMLLMELSLGLVKFLVIWN